MKHHDEKVSGGFMGKTYLIIHGSGPQGWETTLIFKLSKVNESKTIKYHKIFEFIIIDFV